MLKLFSVLKPFDFHDGLAGIIQRNAVSSWLRILSKDDILIVGRDAEDYVHSVGLTCVPVERNENNVPMLRDVWEWGHVFGDDTRMYVNGDIILANDLLPTVRAIERKYNEFLIVGRRIDITVEEEVGEDFIEFAREQGKLHGWYGADYFVWRGDFYGDLPNFILGRGKWDNWLIWRALKVGVPVIDATGHITAIHQEHPRKFKNDDEKNYNHNIAGKKWRGIKSATHRL